jgi:iron complex outermembrane receptor protein
MKNVIAFLFLVCCDSVFLLSQEQKIFIHGTVSDKLNQTVIPYVNVKALNTKWGCMGSADGSFYLELPKGEYWLRFSAVGYDAYIIKATLQNSDTILLNIALDPKEILINAEVVIASREFTENKSYNQNLHTIDDVVSKVEGVTLIRRANFSSEASIRGMGPGQVSAMVDGMKIFSACVDHMDPVSAYVETENLEKLEISKGGFDQELSQNIGGTVNMVTEKPDFKKKLAFQSEAGYESVSSLKRIRAMLNIARGDFAVRGTISYRASGDYSAGRSDKIQGSGFTKNNYKFDLAKKWGADHRVYLSFIGDNAWDIGYPTMLMDTRKTHSQIYSAEHVLESITPVFQSLRTKFYVNHIEHWMDDYDRDVAARDVMQNMYMPMFGKTTTAGITEQALFIRSSQALRVTAEYYYLNAFADMKMESLFPDVSPMYVVNIGRVGLNNLSLSTAYDRSLSKALSFKVQARVDYSNRDMHDPDARRAMSGTWGDEPLQRTYFTNGISITAEYRVGTHVELSVLLGRSKRMPTHLENYGFYLYNIQDGYFYVGNPGLRPETSRQAEARIVYHDEKVRFQTQWYHTWIYDYIMGQPKDDFFRTYANISTARIFGMESNASIALSPRLTLTASAAYTRGYNENLNEPLPMIPPFEANGALIYETERISIGVESRFAASQRRVAEMSAVENRTPAFHVWNVRAALKVNKNIECKFGVENIFNRLYHEHLSINDLPGKGRNLFSSISVTY